MVKLMNRLPSNIVLDDKLHTQNGKLLMNERPFFRYLSHLTVFRMKITQPLESRSEIYEVSS